MASTSSPAPPPTSSTVSMSSGVAPQRVTLASAPLGRATQVRWVHAPGELGERLMEMGLVPGAPVVVRRRSGEQRPLQLEVRGYRLSIGSDEARQIEVEP